MKLTHTRYRITLNDVVTFLNNLPNNFLYAYKKCQFDITNATRDEQSGGIYILISYDVSAVQTPSKSCKMFVVTHYIEHHISELNKRNDTKAPEKLYAVYNKIMEYITHHRIPHPGDPTLSKQGFTTVSATPVNQEQLKSGYMRVNMIKTRGGNRHGITMEQLAKIDRDMDMSETIGEPSVMWKPPAGLSVGVVEEFKPRFFQTQKLMLKTS